MSTRYILPHPNMSRNLSNGEVRYFGEQSHCSSAICPNAQGFHHPNGQKKTKERMVNKQMPCRCKGIKGVKKKLK